MKRLESTKQIPIGSQLRIYKKGYGYAILNVTATSDYFLAALSDAEFMMTVQDGDALEAYLWIQEVASYEFRLEVIGKISSEPHILFFRNTDAITKSRERKCLGAQTRLPIEFFIIKTGDLHKGFSSEKVVFHSGHLIWIEDREAIIKSSVSLEEGIFLRGHVTLDGMDTEIVGKISAINRDKNIYNIMFTGENEDHRNRVLDYIFKIYRE